MEFTEQEQELIAAIRNFKSSKHNYSKALEEYVRELFEEFLESDED